MHINLTEWLFIQRFFVNCTVIVSTKKFYDTDYVYKVIHNVHFHTNIIWKTVKSYATEVNNGRCHRLTAGERHPPQKKKKKKVVWMLLRPGGMSSVS